MSDNLRPCSAKGFTRFTSRINNNFYAVFTATLRDRKSTMFPSKWQTGQIYFEGDRKRNSIKSSLES